MLSNSASLLSAPSKCHFGCDHARWAVGTAFSLTFMIRWRGMFRLLGQFLTVVALMASVINPWCAVSCSLQAIAGSSSSVASAVDIDRADHADHACCSHQCIPKPNEQKGHGPCLHRLPPTEARFESSSAGLNFIPPAVLVGWTSQYGPLIAATHLRSLTPPGASSLSRLSSKSILRI